MIEKRDELSGFCERRRGCTCGRPQRIIQIENIAQVLCCFYSELTRPAKLPEPHGMVCIS